MSFYTTEQHRSLLNLLTKFFRSLTLFRHYSALRKQGKQEPDQKNGNMNLLGAMYYCWLYSKTGRICFEISKWNFKKLFLDLWHRAWCYAFRKNDGIFVLINWSTTMFNCAMIWEKVVKIVRKNINEGQYKLVDGGQWERGYNLMKISIWQINPNLF